MKFIKRLSSRKGEGYIDAVILVLIFVLMLSFILSVTPVFFAKMNMNTFANELVREAEIVGRIGNQTTARYQRLCENKGINPAVEWGQAGKVQIGDEITVTVSTTVDIGFFVFGNIPITVASTASGTSEVFWK